MTRPKSKLMPEQIERARAYQRKYHARRRALDPEYRRRVNEQMAESLRRRNERLAALSLQDYAEIVGTVPQLAEECLNGVDLAEFLRLWRIVFSLPPADAADTGNSPQPPSHDACRPVALDTGNLAGTPIPIYGWRKTPPDPK